MTLLGNRYLRGISRRFWNFSSQRFVRASIGRRVIVQPVCGDDVGASEGAGNSRFGQRALPSETGVDS